MPCFHARISDVLCNNPHSGSVFESQLDFKKDYDYNPIKILEFSEMPKFLLTIFQGFAKIFVFSNYLLGNNEDIHIAFLYDYDEK